MMRMRTRCERVGRAWWCGAFGTRNGGTSGLGVLGDAHRYSDALEPVAGLAVTARALGGRTASASSGFAESEAVHPRNGGYLIFVVLVLGCAVEVGFLWFEVKIKCDADVGGLVIPDARSRAVLYHIYIKIIFFNLNIAILLFLCLQ